MGRSRDQALYPLYLSCFSLANSSIHSANIHEHLLCAWHCLATRGAKVTQTDKAPVLMELLLFFGETETR